MLRVRAAVPDDAPAVVALRAAVYPYLVRGVDSTRRMIADPLPGKQWAAFVVERAGTLIGWASAYRNAKTSEPGFGEISLLHVHPDHRRRGAGDALFAAARRHLEDIGVRRVRTWTSTEAVGFARRHHFEPSREVHYFRLDLHPAPAVPPVPDGVRLLPVADLDPRRLYVADVAATADEPGDVPAGTGGYDAWRYDVWDNIGLDRDVSTAAVIGPDVVAYSLAMRDGDRMWSDMTATVPQHRGRGLAHLVKSAVLRRAAETGSTVAYTSNDSSNGPMLAVNSRLGYRPVATQVSCLATLHPTSAAATTP